MVETDHMTRFSPRLTVGYITDIKNTVISSLAFVKGVLSYFKRENKNDKKRVKY